jgi:glycine cleavage system H lipoate-binding protein
MSNSLNLKGETEAMNISEKQSLKVVPPDKKPCIWMEAGVVSYKLCYNNYDCTTCDYDHAMQQKVAQQRAAAVQPMVIAEAGKEKFSQTWVENMMRLPASKRKCRYMLTGEVERKICPNAYECGNCAFDQMMQDRMQSQTLPVANLGEASGFKWAPDFYYHEGHTWARPEYGGRIRVGFDDFAQRLLGRLSGMSLPEVGRLVGQGEAVVQLKRNGEMVSALSPMDGIVTHLNYRLLEHPFLVNESPFVEGWLYILEPTRLKKNLKGLFFGEAAQKYLAEERDRLMEKANREFHLAADGGASVADIFSQLKGENWAKLVKSFLRS